MENGGLSIDELDSFMSNKDDCNACVQSLWSLFFALSLWEEFIVSIPTGTDDSNNGIKTVSFEDEWSFGVLSVKDCGELII